MLRFRTLRYSCGWRYLFSSIHNRSHGNFGECNSNGAGVVREATMNMLDFGAKCDGATDDSQAILAAVQAASARGLGGGNAVYFPPSKGCVIGSPLSLPDTDLRVTLEFDSMIQLNATLTLGSNYTLRGISPWPKVAMSTEGGTLFN